MHGQLTANRRYDEPEEGVLFSDDRIGKNPFPGLRPFTINESHLFFGREGQVGEILTKLVAHRSVTVMGHSGSGKSSLLSCGLIPSLLSGFVSEYGSDWRVVHVRPGNAPVRALARAIVDSLIQSGKIDYPDRKVHETFLTSVLFRGEDGLVEAVKYVHSKNENFFLLIDQFEEIFRHRESDNLEQQNEAIHYIRIVQYAIHQQESPIFTILSMRSDFVGQCSIFPGLTKLINQSHYLVPKMTREQNRRAIEGPVAVGKGSISGRLVQRILNDLGEGQNQLTIMQHALMRTWDYWIENHEENEPMDIRHYNAVGRIAQALSLHANEAFDELSLREKEIAETMFKCLTERTQDSIDMRRPAKLRLIAQLAEASEAEVIRVVEVFRRSGRSFLIPAAPAPLHGDTIIELSHESLMRIWTRLSTWVNEEFESAQMYRRISDASAMYMVGKTNLWRPPDLQLALNWQKKQRPTRLWAERYGSAFERAIVFLDTSRLSYDAELKNQEMLQRRNTLRLRWTNFILGFFLVIAIGFFFYGYVQQIKAQTKAEEAFAERNKANQRLVELRAKQKLIEENLKTINAQKDELAKRTDDLEKSNVQLQAALREAEEQKRRAEESSRLANEQREAANIARDEADRERQRAEDSYKRANDLLMQNIAQSLEAKSVNIEDPELAGLTAMQGYVFHTKYGGKQYDPYLFSGLYTSLAKIQGSSYNAISLAGGLRTQLLALDLSRKSSLYYASGTDGKITSGDFATSVEPHVLYTNNGHPNRVLALSPDEKYLVAGSDSTYVQIFNLAYNEKPTIVTGHKGLVTDVKFLPDNSGFISSSVDGTLMLTNLQTGQGKIIARLPYDIKSIDINNDGTDLLLGSTTGKVAMLHLMDLKVETLFDEAPHRVLSVAFHPTRNLIAVGIENVNELFMVIKGTVKQVDLNTMIAVELSGHTAGISDLQFSHDGLLLASAGLDGKLQLWVVDHEEELPVVMNNKNGFVWKVKFSHDDKNLIAACNEGEVRVWPTDIKALAEKLCPLLKRNMSQEEWRKYVGRNVSYEETCNGKSNATPSPNQKP